MCVFPGLNPSKFGFQFLRVVLLHPEIVFELAVFKSKCFHLFVNVLNLHCMLVNLK